MGLSGFVPEADNFQTMIRQTLGQLIPVFFREFAPCDDYRLDLNFRIKGRKLGLGMGYCPAISLRMAEEGKVQVYT
jgi:hypothetical protein